jgi:hypothetical protein
MSVESSRNNPLVVTVDQDTRVEAVFSRVTCGNIGDPCRIRNSPGTIQYSACCDGLVCLSDTGNDFWVEGDNEYGTCQSPPSPTPSVPTQQRNSFTLRLTSNVRNGGNVDTREIVGGTNVRLENTRTRARGFERTWSATSGQIDVTVVATPADGYRFVRWSNNVTNTTQTISITGVAELEAIFEEIVVEPTSVTVTIENNPSNLGSATFAATGRSSALTVDRGTTVQVVANPNSPRTIFRNWEIRRASDNQLISTLYNQSDTFLADTDIRVIAYWDLQQDQEIRGCTDSNASNYNPNATVSDGSCVYPEPIRGCTNRSATNYNPNAEIDDGSCVFPRTWKRCSDGAVIDGDAPSDYRLVNDTRPGGTVCWEPIEDVAIDLRDINFTYQRGSNTFPAPQNFRAENSSFGLSYEITLATNNQLFEVSPSKFTLGPRENKQISIGVSRNNIERFGDGVSNFNLVVDMQIIGGEAAVPPSSTPIPTIPPPPPERTISIRTVVVNCSSTGIIGDECEPYTIEGTFAEGVDRLCAKIGLVRCDIFERTTPFPTPTGDPPITPTTTINPTVTPTAPTTQPTTTQVVTNPVITPTATPVIGGGSGRGGGDQPEDDNNNNAPRRLLPGLGRTDFPDGDEESNGRSLL